MKYGYTLFYVEDVKKTIAFYGSAFGFQEKFVTPENDYGELISGETTIAFASLDLGKANFSKEIQHIKTKDQAIGVEMAFVTENIHQDFKRAIDAGAIEFESITEKSWGQKVGYLRDINGILIEICTPIQTK